MKYEDLINKFIKVKAPIDMFQFEKININSYERDEVFYVSKCEVIEDYHNCYTIIMIDKDMNRVFNTIHESFIEYLFEIVE